MEKAMRNLKYLSWFLLFALFIPHAAFAHVVVDMSGGFRSGFTHPLTGPDHLLAMLAVGIWGAQMGGRSIWTLPVTFPLIMTVGGIIGIVAFRIPYTETGIALSVLVLGLAIAFAWKPREIIALALIAFFAICHGYAHGVELPQAAAPAPYAIGFVVATGLIHILGIGIGLIFGKMYHGRVGRAIGAAIAAGGIFYLSEALRRGLL
jgi:urease accessory protein